MTLVDEFKSISLATIAELVSAGREEDLHLDFKVVSDATLSRDDRKSLATALSAFANSDGGIVIWGVEARPNGNGVDCAVALREIPDAALCLTRLNTLTGQAVSPVVDNVQHRAILRQGTSGYCASLVPASDSGPHMAKGGEDRYFKRSGSGLYRMEHFDLEDMFGRRQRPRLKLRIRLLPRADPADPLEELQFTILNTGRGIAKHVGFFCRMESAVTITGVGGGLSNDSGVNDGSPVVSYQESLAVIHPTNIASSVGHAIIQRQTKGGPLQMNVSVYCEGMRVESVSLIVTEGATTAT